MRAFLECRTNGHFKQYEVIVEELSPTLASYVVNYGRIGGNQANTTATVDRSTVERKFEEQVRSKLAKGYDLVELDVTGFDGVTLPSPTVSTQNPSQSIVELPTADASGLEDELANLLAGI